jgi:hypothetical protein
MYDDKMLDKILERLENALVRANRAEDKIKALGIEHAAAMRKRMETIDELRRENARQQQGDLPQLRRVTADAASLLDRDDLSDNDKVRSISGLLDQVMPNRTPKVPFFVTAADAAQKAPIEAATTTDSDDGDASAAGQPSLSPKPTRRTTKARG